MKLAIFILVIAILVGIVWFVQQFASWDMWKPEDIPYRRTPIIKLNFQQWKDIYLLMPERFKFSSDSVPGILYRRDIITNDADENYYCISFGFWSYIQFVRFWKHKAKFDKKTSENKQMGDFLIDVQREINRKRREINQDMDQMQSKIFEDSVKLEDIFSSWKEK